MENILSISIVATGVLLFGLFVIAFFGKLLKHLFLGLLRYSKKWLDEAVEAEAIVLGVQPTGLCINNKPQVRLQLQVKPRKGRNFVIEIKDVEDLGTTGLKAGSVIRVKYNPRNYRQLSLVPFTKQGLPLAV